MKIDRIEQFHLQMPLKEPFETSFGRQTVFDKIILAVYANGFVGYGESPVDNSPFYSYETVETCWHVQSQFLIPLMLEADIPHATDLPSHVGRVRGHPMAKAGLEAALWDLEAQMTNQSLSALMGGTHETIETGVSIGIQNTDTELLDRIAAYREDGYRRIKIKIKPGRDSEMVAAVRAQFPDISLMVDANSAFTLDDIDLLKVLDEYNLLMIEQPLAHDDIIDHAELQAALKTPICLDESIHTPGQAREALALKSCRIINVKPTRVGGWRNAVAIHDICQAASVPVWCGGMLESGIGRAHNVALASLPNFKLPGDISASDRYWEQDIIEPAFTLNENGTITVPTTPGLGVIVLQDRLESFTVRKAAYPG